MVLRITVGPSWNSLPETEGTTDGDPATRGMPGFSSLPPDYAPASYYGLPQDYYPGPLGLGALGSAGQFPAPNFGGDEYQMQRDAGFSRDEPAPLNSVMSKLTGLGGQEERYQLWPEKMVRSGLSLPGDVASGAVSTNLNDPNEDWRNYSDTPPQGYVPRATQRLVTEQTRAGPRQVMRDEPGFVSPVVERGQDTAGLMIGGGMPAMAKMTNALGTSGARPGGPAVTPQVAPPLYSAVEQTLNAVKPTKAPGGQWAGILNNSPGVKPEELKWLGLPEWLKEQKGPVSKDAILDYVKSHQVEIKEVRKGADGSFKDNPDWQRLTKENDEIFARIEEIDAIADASTPGGKELFAERHKLVDAMDENHDRIREIKAAQGAPKFDRGDLKLPGGENYRELLLTLPESRGPFGNKAYDASNAFQHEMHRKYGDGWRNKATAEELAHNRDLDARGEMKNPDYRSTHWDEPNVLAHVRMNDRVIDGKKTLFIEELQSDWHQQGRDYGYGGKPLNVFEENGRFIVRNDAGEKLGDFGSPGAAYDRARAATGAGVPDAPFKKTWPELAMKRMIREAAEKGYDKIAWTPGDVQNSRYNLSKHVSNIEVADIGKSHVGEDIVNLTIYDKGGNAIKIPDASPMATSGQYQVEVSRLPDLIGKDLANKIIEGGDYKNYSGEGLDIGGSGMKGFYDDMLPSAVNKIAKKYGAKVGQSEIETTPANMGRDDAVKQKVHTLDITPELKDAAIQKGFPMFASGVPMVPVDYDPFDDDKKFDTKLTRKETAKYQDWKVKHAPYDSGADYDLRGAFKAGVSADPISGHWPDTFKKPNHPTFSNESQYAKDRPHLAGRWDGETFIPPEKKP